MGDKTGSVFPFPVRGPDTGGRGGQIRTDDFLLPKQALYQAELRPEGSTAVINRERGGDNAALGEKRNLNSMLL